MDLLGSILNSMDKPPSVSDKERERIKSKLENFFKYWSAIFGKYKCFYFNQKLEITVYITIRTITNKVTWEPEVSIFVL